ATASATASWRPRRAHARSAGSARPRPKPRATPRRLLDGAYLGKQFLQLTALVHLQGDVAAADQLAVDVELRVGRPVGMPLERFAHLRLLEDIDVLELRSHGAQGCHRLRGKAALRKVRRAFHEQHHGAGTQLGLDSLDDVHPVYLLTDS